MKKKGDKVTERNTLKFRLKVRCKRNKKAPTDTTNPDELYLNAKVYTRTIEWEPIGEQKNWIPGLIFFCLAYRYRRYGASNKVKLK